MKKKILFLASLVLFFVPLANSFAQESDDYYFTARRKLISLSLEENNELIKEISYRLNLEQRNELFNKYSMSCSSAILKNSLVGFGTGSQLQGDEAGAKIAKTLELSGMGVLLATGIVLQIIDKPGSPNYSEKEPSIGVFSITGAGIAVGLFLGGRIFSMFRPAWFAEKYNSLLRTSLRLDENTQLSFVPLVNPLEKEFGLMTQVRL